MTNESFVATLSFVSFLILLLLIKNVVSVIREYKLRKEIKKNNSMLKNSRFM